VYRWCAPPAFDRREVVLAEDEVALPVARDRAVIGLGGRSVMLIMSGIWLRRLLACGRAPERPPGSQARVRSRRNAPRDWTYKDW